MAWQLIYTSAPRSLEAGRSGFGTVARHRAISPLLVSAIERTSQFSRLPGVDTGRVIFSYRIVAVAGGRFHVLSSIRDAGADYTGRTNHIAHHLIADPREIAQLGANGPSPADVLLAMQWATSWTEQPRFFEAADEIALATMQPQRNGSAWQQITGSSDQAWLLASGDASRGAYVIQPAGTDLRAVFAESLRLIPERLWQISFTTSLQPSDEPADFRWIGIEERSPLRAQTESSGRPTLNLTAPNTLPLVEVAQPVASVSVAPLAPSRMVVASASAPLAASTRSPDPFRLPGEQLSGKAPDGHGTFAGKKTSRPLPWIWIAVTAVVFILTAIWYLIVDPYLKKQTAEKSERETNVKIVIETVDFTKATAQGGKHPDLNQVSPIDLNRLKKLADLTREMISAMKDTDFDKMRGAEQAFTKERNEAAKFAMQVPTEFAVIQKRLQDSIELHDELEKFPALNESDRGFSHIQEIVQKIVAAEGGSAPHATSLQANLRETADAKEVSTLLALLQGNMPPKESRAWFTNAADAGDKRVPASIGRFQPVRALIEDWKFTEEQPEGRVLTELEKRRDERTKWPEWLKRIANKKIEDAQHDKPLTLGKPVPPTPPNASNTPSPPANTPTPLSRVPLYFVNGKDSLSNFRIEELGPNLKFFLKLGLNGDTVALGDLNKNGTLRRSVAGDPDFEVKEDQKIIGAAKGAATLTLPFALSAKDAMGTEVFQLWVVSALSEPLFGVKTSGLNNDGTKVFVDPIMAPLPGATRATLYLETPSDFLPGSKISEHKLNNLSLELAKIIAPIQQERQTYIKQRDAVATPTEQSLFDEFTAEAQTFLKDGLPRLTGIVANPRHKLCGAMLQAFSIDWERLGLSTAKDIPKPDAVFSKGTILLDEQLKKADEVEKAIKDTLLFVQGITKHKNLSGPDKVKVRKLTALENMIVLAGADAEEAKTLLAQRIKYADQQRERADKKVKDIDSLPLLNRAIPPGKYRLLVGIGSSDSIGSGTETKIPLWDFTIQIPDSLK